MNPRERVLAICVATFIVVGGSAFVFHQFFWSPLQQRSRDILLMQEQVDKKTSRVQEIRAEMPQFDKWRALTLPANVDNAGLEYGSWLSDLAQKHRFGGATVSPKPPDLKSGITATGAAATKTPPVYAKLGYSVTGRASLAQLVSFLKDFYEAGLLHQVRTISIQRPQTLVAQQQRTDLDISMSIEALSLTGVDQRKSLLPGMDIRMVAVAASAAWRQGPVGLAFVPDTVGPRGRWGPNKLAPADYAEEGERNYADIAKKDIFIGRAAAGERDPRDNFDPSRFFKLTDIVEASGAGNTKTRYANIWDQYNNKKLRLQVETNSTYSDLSVRDDSFHEVFHGKVVKINDTDVILKNGDKYYRLKVGNNMDDALKHVLTKDELTREGLVAAAAQAAADAGADDDGLQDAGK